MISALLGKEFGLYSQCNVKSVWGFVQLSDTQWYSVSQDYSGYYLQNGLEKGQE